MNYSNLWLAFAFVICTVVFSCFRIVNKWRKVNKLYEHVNWCVTTDYNGLGLNGFLHNTQIELIKNSNYRFSPRNQRETVNHILDEYKNNLCVKFAKGELVIDRTISKLTHEEYFMVSFGVFLSENQNTSATINNQPLYEYKETNDSGKSIYTLTDYGMVFYKLSLIAFAYCGHNKRTSAIIGYNFSEQLISAITSGEVAFYRHHG